MNVFVAGLVLSACCAARTATGAPAEPLAAAQLERASVPAAGRHDVGLTVPRFGRYAITVKSDQGTALQLVDRMAGPGEVAGASGESDGRIDLFLDRGAYRIVTFGPEKGRGTANLLVSAFDERGASPPPQLVELKTVADQLADLEQKSFAFPVTTERTVIVEAAGRNLGDLRLWRDGNWLVDATPVVETTEPQPGRPLTLCRLVARLSPGSYILTAYGGPALPWPAGTDEHPLFLRAGIPPLAEAGRHRFVASPFGVDRWLLPLRANYVRLELPESRPATLRVDPFDPDAPFTGRGTSADIGKTTVPPVAELKSPRGTDAETDGKWQLVTVRAEWGRPYLLQHFVRARAYTFDGTGEHWIASVTSGDPLDSADTTMIVTARQIFGAPAAPQPVAFAQAATIGSAHDWSRRFNLLGTTTVFLQVEDDGEYELRASGTPARFRIEPFFAPAPPEHYEPPPPQGPGTTFKLTRGYFVLTALPDKPGIVTIDLRRTGLPRSLTDRVPGTDQAQEGAPRAGVLFPRARLESSTSYTAYVNERPEVRVGLVVRRLPLDLAEPLPVAQQPGETVTVPFRVEEPARLTAEAEDGTVLPISLDGAPPEARPLAAPGEHSVAITVTGARPVLYSLSAVPERLLPDAPLPPAEPNPPAAPRFAELVEGRPLFLDLARQASATFAVRADAPGLYRLSSSGLLRTAGNLRTRTVTSLDRTSANGSGLNFLIQQYLREGDYQLTVATTGDSAGHLGVRLDRTDLVDAGELFEGSTARRTLPAGQAAVYRFTIADDAEYRLEAYGQQGHVRGRLEDGDGWPIEPPGRASNHVRRFAPGSYRLVLLPGAETQRVVASLTRVAAPPHFEGHGPHALPLGTTVAHVWREGPGDGVSEPDSWDFVLPAPVDLDVELSGEMQARLLRRDDAATNSTATKSTATNSTATNSAATNSAATKDAATNGAATNDAATNDAKSNDAATNDAATNDAPTKDVAFVPPGRGWHGQLDAGAYRLEARCSRRNNGARYTVGVTARQLVPGTSKTLHVPGTLELSLGQPGLVLLESSGRTDVRGRLYDEADRLVARNDDRPDDWNFLVTARLAAGRYRLVVDPVGTDAGSAVIAASLPREREEAPARPPFAADYEPEQGVRVVPLDLGPLGRRDGILVASVQAAGPASLALEQRQDTDWVTLAQAEGSSAQLAVPLTGAESGALRLRFLTPEPRGGRVRLAAVLAKPRVASERALAAGLGLKPVAGSEPPLVAASVETGTPGVFRIAESSPASLRFSARSGVACAAASADQLAVPAGRLWVVAPAGGKPAPSVRAQRLRLGSGPGGALRVTIPAGETARVDLAPAASAAWAVLATSAQGQPGLALAGDGLTATGRGGLFAAGPGSALAVSLAGTSPVLRAWNAGRRDEPLDVRLAAVSVPPPDSAEPLPAGVAAGVLGAAGAKAFALAPGVKQLDLTIGASVVAVLARGTTVLGVHWLGGSPFTERVVSDADRLVLLPLDGLDARYTIDVSSPLAPPAGGTVAEGAPIEVRRATAGIDRFAVAAPAAAGSALHVRAPAAPGDAEPVFVGDDGSVLRGGDLSPAAAGTLLVPHGPGTLLVWVDRPGADAADLFGSPAGMGASPVSLPATVRADGARQLLFTITRDEPCLLLVRSDAPLVGRVNRGGAAGDVVVQENGARFDAYLPAGVSTLALRGLAGAVLSGTIALTATPITPVREGLGPPTLVPPGGAAAFSFVADRKGAVGIGVNATSDLVEADVVDGAGRRIARGLVTMPELAPGPYVIIVRAGAAAGPVTVRPALAGVEPPSADPPAEVVRRYLADAQRSAGSPAAGNRVLVSVPVPLAPPAGGTEEAADAEDEDVDGGTGGDWDGEGGEEE